MKVDLKHNYSEIHFTFSELETYKYRLVIILSTDTTNCKLSYIHGIGNISTLNDKEKKEIIDYILKYAKGCLIINTVYKTVYEFIKDNYPVYYAQEVPIGYYDKFQYHICIKNTIVVNTNCRTPKKIIENNKELIKEKLTIILKSKRRKTDYIDEFIDSL